MVETLYQDKNHKIDFYRSVSPARGLVYTFTSIAFSDLNASGFGVHFLLGLGYDVVAFKCNNASWYQGLDFDTVRAVGRKSSGYEQVATYGTSMGGYAAILFSKALGANLVLALSPQFSLAESFEQRWRDKTKGVEWRHEISAETIAAQATYMILYDDKFMLDVRQMAGLKAILPPLATHMVGIPFSNHHTIVFLLETGQLTAIVTSILRGDGMIAVKYLWSKISKSAEYLHSLGLHAQSLGRLRLARLCLKRCVAIRPNDVKFSRLLSELQNGREVFANAGRVAGPSLKEPSL